MAWSFVNPKTYARKYDHSKHSDSAVPWSHAHKNDTAKENARLNDPLPWNTVPELVAESLNEEQRKADQPAFTLQEVDGNIYILGKVPHMSTEDIDIKRMDNRITISSVYKGERSWPQIARHQGQINFSDTFEISEPVQWDEVNAHMHNGYLSIVIPRK
ncbi:MAG: Hsp20 family protein [Chitinivibrionales bacterium]|nr:Hsp20 family protein [Chitinivibrionales bacterium]